jgi:hypothetical protein
VETLAEEVGDDETERGEGGDRATAFFFFEKGAGVRLPTCGLLSGAPVYLPEGK